jgi:hypothetical protein
MFAELGLPVCDDGARISQKLADKRDYYLSLLRKPDPNLHKKGESGVKNGEALQNRRPELLQVVYDHFARLGDTALSGFAATGEGTLTTPVLENLRHLLSADCRVDDDLAGRFLGQYLRDRGLEQGKGFITPGAISVFTAASGIGHITLRWSWPATNCDLVEITREAESINGQNGSATAEVVYQGRDTSYTDYGCRPGEAYRYRANSVYQDKFRGTPAFARAVCLGEVREAKAVWQDGAVRLSWTPPGRGSVAFLVFRRSDGLEGAAPPAVCIQQGSGTSCTDTSAAEGATHHYRIIADFGAGLRTEGVQVQVTVPRPPPPVPVVTATFRHEDGRALVEVAWEPVRASVPVKYVVVRREGGTPPGRVEEGTLLLTSDPARPVTRLLDEQVSPGRRYTYAVFTQAGDQYSRDGTASPSVDVLAEVVGLEAATGDGTVALSWKTPANVSRVIVRRSLHPPRDPGEGMSVPLTGAGHATDAGLRNGQCYYYLVCCAYRPDGVHEAVSPGVRIEAVPDRLPELVRDFHIVGREKEVVCQWTPPPYGQAVVLRAARPHGLPPGQRLKRGELDRLGERLVVEEGCRAVDRYPDVNKPHYSVFTVAGEHAIAGGTGLCLVSPDVSALQAWATRDGVLLRWAWPAGCTAVRVVRRADAWPTGPEDPQATTIHCTRSAYTAAGEKFVDPIHQERALLHYVIYAQAAGASTPFFAPGTDSGCRASIRWEPWTTVSYQLAPLDAGSDRTPALRLTWSVETPLPNFSGLVLVGNPERVPVAPEDGVELFRWTPRDRLAAGDHEARVSLEPVRLRRWARFFCKLMVLNPAQRHAALVIHPNTCLPLSATGDIQTPFASRQGYMPARVPHTVVCPSCFERFPVQQIRFSTFGGIERVNASYTWVHRLLRRPLKPPRNRLGQVLPSKHCPKCDKGLPFTAGSQGSLVIGLIGAKFSGKSHYIAALIQRLEGQVGADLEASILPVTDETPRRYRQEFHDPLFKNHFELPLTVGTPDPLIYDLTLSGRLWSEETNRAVTLALYDTAGENFNDPVTVRRMVRYLGVASGIMLLVDPLQLPAVREALPGTTRLPDAEDPNAIIGRVLKELENGRVLTQNAPLETPVAVVLTKADVLRDAGLIEANRLWSTDARHIGAFDTRLHEDISGMVGEYVQRWSPAVYNTVARRFMQHSFFAVSATGCASDTNTRRYRYIAPWRVEDPLLWLLAEMGVIPRR